MRLVPIRVLSLRWAILALLLPLTFAACNANQGIRLDPSLSAPRPAPMPQQPPPPPPAPPTPAATGGAGPEPYVKLDELKQKFPGLLWQQQGPDNAELAKRFELVRANPGWKAFVEALRSCDDAVNTLLEENILDWSNAAGKIGTINDARNRWRKACTYGIQPPQLPQGRTTFEESGLGFLLLVDAGAQAKLIVRSQRGQVLGLFEVNLNNGGNQHLVTHMLERALRNPDTYFGYPWDIIIATDTIFVPDVHVVVDRVKGEANVVNQVKGEVEVKK